MKVLKKDGRLQDYNLDKIKLSIERASDEARQPFTLSDIEILGNDIHKKILDLEKDTIKSEEIHNIVYKQLKYTGFDQIATCYKNYAKGESCLEFK